MTTPATAVRTTVSLRNRDLFGAQMGLAIMSGAKRGKVDLFGTFKYHLSVWRGAVDREIEMLTASRRDLRDSMGRRDGKNQLVTAQTDPLNPNAISVVLENPHQFETEERQILDQAITIEVHVPKLRLEDILALDFGDQQGDYSGALLFIEQPDAITPAPTEKSPEKPKTRLRREA